MIFFWAMLLRLGLMPVTMHSDLLFTNYFPYFLSAHHIWDIYGYFGDHYLKHGHTYYAPLIYYLTGLSQWALSVLNPGFNAFMEHAHELMYSGSAASMQEYLEPFSLSQRFQFAFMMKLPYLLSDGLCVFFIAKFFDSEKEKNRAFVFWLLNPVLIFSVYIFGTYRIYPALALWAFLYCVRQDKKMIAGLVFGLLLLMDNFPWILLAPTFLVLGRDWRERIRLFAVCLAPFAVIFGALYVSSNGYVKYAYLSPLLKKAAFQSLTNHFASQAVLAAKLVFASAYVWILFRFVPTKGPVTLLSPCKRTELIIWVDSAVMLLFYATSQTLAHYFMWILPFFVVLQARGEPWRSSLSWLLMALLFLFNLDKRTLNLGLLMPLDPAFFFSVPSLHEIMDQWLPWGKVVAASRLLFSILCFIFIQNIFERRINPLLETARAQ